MSAPTVFRRLFVAQLASAVVLLVIAGGAFYVERNRTIARLLADRWAPALRTAAGLAPAPAATGQPDPRAVVVADARPADPLRQRMWARVAVLRDRLRADGLPVGQILFTPGRIRPMTWLEVTRPDGSVRWLGFDDDVIEAHVVGRTVVTLVLGLMALALASGLVARRVARPLEALRRRIEAHDGAPAPDGPGPRARGATQEVEAIEHAWLALRERLAQHESERGLLLAGVSHDLRSPLARIRMAAELLPEEPGIAERRASIVRNVDVADRLIASFLDYVRATEAPLDANVDLVALARRQVEMRELPADILAFEAPARLELAHASELLLERVVGNLLDNAFDALADLPSDRDRKVELTLDGDDQGVVAHVGDSGPGLTDDQARHALERGWTTKASAEGLGGRGLGLALVGQVARRHGGTLTVGRSPLGGAEITVEVDR